MHAAVACCFSFGKYFARCICDLDPSKNRIRMIMHSYKKDLSQLKFSASCKRKFVRVVQLRGYFK